MPLCVYDHDGRIVAYMTVTAWTMEPDILVAIGNGLNRLDEASGLADQPKPGRGNNVPLATVGRILSTVMGPPPKGYSHWSTGLIGRKFDLSRTVVHKILRANDVQPHRHRTFKVSKHPKFDEKVLDVVGLYLNPPDKAVILSVDEKTQVQALERTQPMLPLRPGQVAHHTHDYKRNGVIDLYAALEVATGNVVHRVTDSHTGADFLGFLKQLARAYPDVDLYVIIDNSSTHSTPDVTTWLAANPSRDVSFHTDERQLAQSGRRPLRHPDQALASAHQLPEQVGATPPHRRFPQGLEPSPNALHLDKGRAHHHQPPPTDACANLANRTLEGHRGAAARGW